jgi:hypothetical protein
MFTTTLNQRVPHAQIDGGTPPLWNDAAIVDGAKYVLALRGECYELRFDGEYGLFAPSKGLKIIHALIQRLNSQKPTSVIILDGGDENDEASARAVTSPPVTTQKFLGVCHKRKDEIEERLRDDDNAAAIDRLPEEERTLLEEQFKKVTDYLNDSEVCGRPKTFDNALIVRAKDNVRKAMKAAYKKMEKDLPQLVVHLRSCIRQEGDAYAYRSFPAIHWQF